METSSVGIDIGNERFVVAVAWEPDDSERASDSVSDPDSDSGPEDSEITSQVKHWKLKVDTAINAVSERATPAVVYFGDKQRLLGVDAADRAPKDPHNSVSQVKRLLGRKFADPELQSDLAAFHFRVTEGSGGFPLVHVRYLGEDRAFTPTQLLAMLLSNMKAMAERRRHAVMANCCIAVPVFFTERQRSAVLDAASIAGLSQPRLVHDLTAVALAYGFPKVNLPVAERPLIVAFVDVGHASMQVCVAEFSKSQLTVLSHAHDKSLGGRDIDSVLFNHFTAKFHNIYGIDVHQSARATHRLRAECAKLKTRLNPKNREQKMIIDCFMDGKDVEGVISFGQLEGMCRPILERVKAPLAKAVADARRTPDAVEVVEVVGLGSIFPGIQKTISEFFGGKLSRTLDPRQCVARGCAILSAILDGQRSTPWELKVNDPFLDPEPIYGRLAPDELQRAVEAELAMARQSEAVREVDDAKNDVEAYIYDMLRELEKYKYYKVVSGEEDEACHAKFQEVLDWMHEDGDDETKGVYVAKLQELQQLGELLAVRYEAWKEEKQKEIQNDDVPNS